MPFPERESVCLPTKNGCGQQAVGWEGAWARPHRPSGPGKPPCQTPPLPLTDHRLTVAGVPALGLGLCCLARAVAGVNLLGLAHDEAVRDQLADVLPCGGWGGPSAVGSRQSRVTRLGEMPHREQRPETAVLCAAALLAVPNPGMRRPALRRSPGPATDRAIAREHVLATTGELGQSPNRAPCSLSVTKSRKRAPNTHESWPWRCR